MSFMCLKILVGERGFEPPTPWSRTRFHCLLKFVEFCCFQVIDVDRLAAFDWMLLNSVEVVCSLSYKIVYIFQSEQTTNPNRASGRE